MCSYIECIPVGVIFLLIHRMSATFGKLRGQTLELKDGLNIIQAPNETGKSTWCAFLVSMLYGINSRERDRAGFIADKNRYAPWSGTAMSGRLDCLASGDELTITRTTRRQTSPLGEFKAVYTGTGDEVPGLTGPTCGETLLGVGREVFERSAFIRQAGLPITQDAGLERRISALVSFGEEGTSYSEAADLLKKQLNRRRHNKTGQLPVLESELAEAQRQLEDLDSLQHQLADAQAQAEHLTAQEASLQEELALHDRWEAQEKRRALEEAEAAAQQARRAAGQLRQRLDEERIPENDTIGRLRGAIVNLNTTRKAVDRARAERDETMKALLKAESAVNGSPFAGQTAESAKKEASEPPKVQPSLTGAILFGLCGAGAVAILAYVFRALGTPALLGILCGGLLFTAAGIWGILRAAFKKAQNAALLKRFGTADQVEITALADTYIKLLEARDSAQADANSKSATADALYNSLTSNEQGILLEVRRFAPAAFDIPTADQLLRSCAVRRQELVKAEAAAREAAMRADLLARQAPDAKETADIPLTAPARSREAVSAQLAQVRAALAAARSAADRLAGQLHALGDPVVLRSSLQTMEEQRGDLEAEYDAIRLAMDTLDAANTTLQSRFSPELGRRAAEIFRELTDGRYSGVVLDRAFHLSAEPAGDSVYRDAQLLSAGASDQLYLAVRLAICELVLPEAHAVPIILDDALANFDDERCAAALRWLKVESRKRQILLFTCHSREADFFRADGEVSVQQLTQTP